MNASGALSALLDRAEAAGWSGADPYDALLSPLGRIAIRCGPISRVLATQAALRVPGVRALSPAPHTVNPKGLGLFLGSVARGRLALGEPRALRTGCGLVRLLAESTFTWSGGRAWGYPFPWQSRFFWAPLGTPNAVATATVGWHALDFAEAFGSAEAGDLGQQAARFIRDGLFRTPVGREGVALAYTPNDRSRIVNVSALGARLLARTGDIDIAGRLLGFILSAQRPDGSWLYAQESRGGWEDSFHTGFVLEALVDLGRFGLDVPEEVLTRGFRAYARFFDRGGAARLSPAPNAPYDAHSAAQGVLTYAAIHRRGPGDLARAVDARGRALAVARWSLDNFYLPKQGYFAYRVHGRTRDEREFTRWVQAWMALAMATAAGIEADVGAVAESTEREHTRVGD